MQTIPEIIDEIKKRRLNVSEIARDTKIPVQRFHKWVQGLNMPKTEDADKLRSWAKDNLDKVLNIVEEDQAPYGNKKPNIVEKDISLKVIFNLTESNRILSEANKQIAESNSKLADNTIELTRAFIAHPGQGTSPDVSATLVGLQEFLVEVAAHVHQTSASEMKAALGKKMVDAKKQIDKKGSPSGVHK